MKSLLLVCLILSAAVLSCAVKIPSTSQPLKPCDGEAEKETGIGCGRGSSGGCPENSYCDIHPADAFATCCCKGPIVRCIVHPCRFATCPAFPDATCKSEICNRCRANFFVNGRKVDCDKPVTRDPNTPCSRRGGTDLDIYCGRGSTGACPGSSYCDIHPADWFATCCCNDPAATCPNCTRPVNCYINPCDVTNCPNLPFAKCVADYCGGCNARFFIGPFEVTKWCHSIWG